MSSSTLPKSIQAQNANLDGGNSTNSDAFDRTQRYKEFINKYKQLPDDFLRIPQSYYPQADQLPDLSSLPQAIVASQGQLVDMIDISVVEAQLVKNYGLLRMDLYCKIRVGHMVCETPTCPNGAKNPKWDGVYQFSLKPGIDSFHLEIYDEKQFSLDEKVAWLYERIPPEVYQGITVERWFSLSGRLGPNKEGSVLLVISHKRVPIRSSNFGRMSHHRHHGGGAPMTVFVPAPGQPQMIGGPTSVLPVDTQINAYVQPSPPPQHQSPRNAGQQPLVSGGLNEPNLEVRPASEEDINQLSEMFPSIDRAIIKAILENNNHDKEAAIGALLAMSAS